MLSLTQQEQNLIQLLRESNYINFDRLQLEICRKNFERDLFTLLTKKGFNISEYPILLQQFMDILFSVDVCPSVSTFANFISWCDRGIIDPKKLWIKTNILDCYFDELYSPNNSDLKNFIDDISKKLIKWKGKEGQKADVGDGERLITIFTTNAICRGNDKEADIVFDGKEIDAKGSASRLQGSKDNGGVISAGKVFAQCMTEITGQKHNIKDFNFNKKGLSNYTSIMQKYSCSVDKIKYPFVKALSLIFTDVSEDKINSFLDASIVNNQIDPTKFMLEYDKFQFEIYTEKHNLAGVLFVNPNTCSIRYVTNSTEFSDLIVSKQIKVNTSQNWSQERNATYQYTVV